MTETIERKLCDICKKEVEHFNGLLVLDYTDSDYTGYSYPVIFEYKEICINCCRELGKTITKAVEELS